MAIAQHQFYLDAKSARNKDLGIRDPPDLAVELSRSCLSLSTHSSSSNLSRSGSHSSLQHNSQTDSCSSESLHLARMELLSALQQRHVSLQEKLKEKTDELRILCMREGELTGELPVEYPLMGDESPPIVRRRVGTSFTLDEGLINKIINKPDESVSSLELEYDIQAKITCAALRLANESSQKKGVRRQRRQWHQMASMRLRDIEKRLNAARSRQGQLQMPKAKKKPRPISEGDACDELSLGNSIASLSNGSSMSVEPSRDISMLDASLVSPAVTMLHSTSSSLSAPPSPQRVAAHAMQASANDGRSNSPHRPTSGYIPSCVYTRNQYRSQHYPTLSTRGGSVPPNSNKPPNCTNQHTSFNGGLYNLPHQRTSLASHSLDDLDASLSTPPSSSSLSSTPPIVRLNQPQPPHHKHFHHHHHQRKRNNTTVATEHHVSNDRYGSLDRRRATSGRLESRSMEHLDTLPPNNNNNNNTNVNPNMSKEALPLTPHYPTQISRYGYHNEPLEGSPYPSTPQYLNESNPNYPLNLTVASDVVDGPQFNRGQLQNDSFCSDLTTRQRLVRTSSGRSYVETTFVGEENIPPASSLPPLRASSQTQRKTEGNTTGLRPTASVNAADHLRPFRLAASDLIPLRATKSNSVLPPLKPTNGREDSPSQANFKHTPGSSANLYNHSAQSYSRLNGHIVNSKAQLPTSCANSKTVTMQNGLLETSLSSPLNMSSVSKHSMDNSSNNCSYDVTSHLKTPQNMSMNTSVSHVNYSSTPSPISLKREPLLSLSEAAKLQKERWDKSKDIDADAAKKERMGSNSSENRETTMSSNKAHDRDFRKDISQPFNDSVHHGSYRPPLGQHSIHNLSTSSVTSSGSSNSVFHSTTEGSDSMNSSLNATLTIESPRNQLVITSGSFQPPREITKPFEMSDFYKYSTKFRRQSSQGSTLNGSGSDGSGSDAPLSPAALAGVVNSPVCSKHIPPPSPSLIAATSSPAPQQKGVYTPLVPLSCKPMNGRTSSPSPIHEENGSQVAQNGSWEHTAMHQAVPVTLTNKRAATLV